MADYISRNEAINAIKSLESSMPAKDNYAKGYDAALGRALITVREVPPAADVQSVYCAENVQNEVLNYLFNKEREAESMSYGDKRQERIVTIREIIRFVEDIDPRMDGDTNG